jgi:hypothetical protein
MTWFEYRWPPVLSIFAFPILDIPPLPSFRGYRPVLQKSAGHLNPLWGLAAGPLGSNLVMHFRRAAHYWSKLVFTWFLYVVEPYKCQGGTFRYKRQVKVEPPAPLGWLGNLLAFLIELKYQKGNLPVTPGRRAKLTCVLYMGGSRLGTLNPRLTLSIDGRLSFLYSNSPYFVTWVPKVSAPTGAFEK